MSNIVIIFGAGASYSAPYNKPVSETPPLKDHLFHNEYLKLKNRSIDIEYICQLFHSQNKPIEVFLKELYENIYHNTDQPNKKQILRGFIETVYYLQDLMQCISNNYSANCLEKTCYHQLLKLLQKKHSSLSMITFNYDTLLESALSSLGFEYDNIDSYINHPYKIIKPHGSCNWSYSHTVVPQKYDDYETMINKLELLDENYLSITKTRLDTTEANKLQMFPCLTMPTDLREGFFKKKFVCPKKHLQTMEENLDQADKILIIGWSGNEDHFGEKLRQRKSSHTPEILIISKGLGEHTKKQIAKYISTERTITYDEGFKTSLVDGTIENFI